MPFHNFFGFKNLSVTTGQEMAPWDFVRPPEDAQLEFLRSVPKAQRRKTLLQPTYDWNIFSAVGGIDTRRIIDSQNNPARHIRGFVADYDVVQDIDQIVKTLNNIDPRLLPQKIEVTLGMKARGVWIFAEDLCVPGNEFAGEFLRELSETLGAPTMLPGYDKASTTPSERWTNGGVWYDITDVPLQMDFIRGVAMNTGSKTRLFDDAEIPLEKVFAEVEKRWPGRWTGDFVVNATGVRFWDKNADAESGCQVKPDGMLCFTGDSPFRKWRDIFGMEWWNATRTEHLGQAARGRYFDGQVYWVQSPDGNWDSLQRQDFIMRLVNEGLSERKTKDSNGSQMSRVLQYVQEFNRVSVAMPLTVMRPGRQRMDDGSWVLNTSQLIRMVPADTGDPAKWPWLYKFFHNFLHDGEHALPYLFAWLQRAVKSFLTYRRTTGQAAFFCGPKNAGKTLFINRVLNPMLGGTQVNPFPILMKHTQFTDDMFRSYLLAMNDEEGPTNDRERAIFQSSIKSIVVNPAHTYHPKFRNKATAIWNGRLAVSLNDDPASLQILPEVNSNTQDKLMFFRVKTSEEIKFLPDDEDMENLIKAELPYFMKWLLDDFKPPQEIVTGSRMGIESYFDPSILTSSRQQAATHNLAELMGLWIRSDSSWSTEESAVRDMTPTEILSSLNTNELTSRLATEWTIRHLRKGLLALVRIEGSGVSYSELTGQFTIQKAPFL